jgi:hypothetical protein
MKRPQPDIGDILRDRYLMNLSTTRKLKRLWGTTTVSGVEVLNLRQYYWKEPRRGDNFEKLFKLLSAYDSIVEGDYSSLDAAWLYFNKNNADNALLDPNSFVSTNLNSMWWDPADGAIPENLKLTTKLYISTGGVSDTDKARVDELLNPLMTKEAIKASITDHYEELWDMCSITQEGLGVINKGSTVDPVYNTTIQDEDDLSPDDPWLSTLARYALRSSGVTCTVKDVNIGSISSYGGKNVAIKRVYNTTYIVEIEIPYENAYTTGNAIVQSISGDLVYNYNSDSKTNGFKTQKIVKAMEASDLIDNPDLVSRSYLLWESAVSQSSTIFDSLWHLEDGRWWYLKADAFDNPRAYGLTYKQLNTYVLPLLDNGFKKKEPSAFETALAVALVIIAFVVAYVAPGPGTKLGAQLLAVAKAIVVASLVLSLATLAFAVVGMTDLATAFGQVSKAIEPLVRVAQIVTLTAGMHSAFEETAKEIAKEKSIELGTDVVASEIATSEVLSTMADNFIDDLVERFVDSFTDTLVEGFNDVVAGNLTTNAALAFSSKMMNIVDIGYKLKLKSIAEKNKDLQTEYDDMQKELAQESDALKGFSLLYSKPATADWSMYSSQFDMPYERGGGQLAMGNIQRTTKQAIRKANYDDPAFAGILII